MSDTAELIKGMFPPPFSRLDNRTMLVAKLQERENHLRESWVQAMEARLVRDELVKCQRYEGVNHLENCSWLAQKYIKMLQENRVRSLWYLHVVCLSASQVKGYKKIEV